MSSVWPRSLAEASVQIEQAVKSITTTSLPAGAVGTVYSQTLTAVGGTLPLTWSFTGFPQPTTPPGLTLTAAGVILGTPTVPGHFTFFIRVNDSGGQTDANGFSIDVAGPLTITTKSLADGIVGRFYSRPVISGGGTAPVSWAMISGSLPGVALNASTGVLSGTPIVVGNQTFTVQVTDALGVSVQSTLSVNVRAVLTITSPSSFMGTVGIPFSQALAVTGGIPIYLTTISSGMLPGGLQLSSLGITGTPTTVGTFNADITVADGATK